MIYICKGREPASLTQYRQTEGAYFDGYENKDELRDALLRDQGYLCAYCMRRISNDRFRMKIEHWTPESLLPSDKAALDYKIMLGVCDGCRGDLDKNTTCDEHRHNAEIYVNPLDETMMETIYYTRDGKIYSTNSRISKDLDQILNLNCEQARSRLVLNRKKIYEECKKRLMNFQRNGNWKKGTVQKVMNYYHAEPEGRKREYVGVPLYILKRALNRLS